MAKKKTKPKKKAAEQVQRPKDFLDMIAPAAIKFNTDHFILGSRYHTAMTLKSYPPMTDELALLRGLGDMGGVNLRLTARQVTPAEEDAILHAATNKSRMERSNTNDYKQSVTADANLRDMAELLAKQRQEKGRSSTAAFTWTLPRRIRKSCARRGTPYPPNWCAPAWAPIRCSCASGRAFSPPTPRAAASLPILRSGSCLPGALPICTP